MARWGSCDYKELQRLHEHLERLQAADLEKFCRDVSRELAARLLALAIPRTPVGDYAGRAAPSGKMGGTLRRGWTAQTEQSAAGGSGSQNARAYAQSLPVTKQGSAYTVEVVNPVRYASYVEFGHRTPGGKGWVAGQYFLTLSERDLRALAPALVEKRLEARLREVFRV